MIRLSGEAGRAPVPEADDGPLADDVGFPIAGDDLEMLGRGEAQLFEAVEERGLVKTGEEARVRPHHHQLVTRWLLHRASPLGCGRPPSRRRRGPTRSAPP